MQKQISKLSDSQAERLGRIVTPESVAQVGLTEVIANNHDQVIDPKQRYVSRDQFLDLLAHAVSLRVYELNRKIGSNLDHKLIDSDIGINNGNMLPESALYSAADYVSLPREYVDKAILSFQQSPEETFDSIKKLGAEPSPYLAAKTYRSMILQSLKSEFPMFEFTSPGNADLDFYYPKFYMGRKYENKKFLWWEWEKIVNEGECIAEGCFNYSNFHDISISSNLFTHACKDVLEKIKSFSEKTRKVKFDIIYNYDAGLSELILDDNK